MSIWSIHQIYPEIKDDRVVLQDNAPSYTSLAAAKCLAKFNIATLPQVTYNPDLTPKFLFKWKRDLIRFQCPGRLKEILCQPWVTSKKHLNNEKKDGKVCWCTSIIFRYILIFAVEKCLINFVFSSQSWNSVNISYIFAVILLYWCKNIWFIL